MKKILFVLVAMAMSLSVALAQETEVKVNQTLISQFYDREIAESLESYRAISLEQGYVYDEYYEGELVGFLSVMEHYDNIDHRPCVKIRIVYNTQMLVISYFGKAGKDGIAEVENFGYTMKVNDKQIVIVAQDGATLVLDAKAVENGKVVATVHEGFKAYYATKNNQPIKVE